MADEEDSCKAPAQHGKGTTEGRVVRMSGRASLRLSAGGRGKVAFLGAAPSSTDDATPADDKRPSLVVHPRRIVPYLDPGERLAPPEIDATALERIAAETGVVLAGPPLAEAKAILDEFQHSGFLEDAAVPVRNVRAFFLHCAEEAGHAEIMAKALARPLAPGILSTADAEQWRLGRASFGWLHFSVRRHGLRMLERGTPDELAAKITALSDLREVARAEIEALDRLMPAHRGPSRDDTGRKATRRLLEVFAAIGGGGKRKFNHATGKLENGPGLKFVDILLRLPPHPRKKPNVERAARGQERRDPIKNKERRGTW